jgi:predicted nucleic acid-binding protein
MNVVDSSLWLEHFIGTGVDDSILEVIENTDELIVPTTVIYEVSKRLLSMKDVGGSMIAVLKMRKGRIIDLNEELSLFAAQISIDHKLSFADSIIYATTLKYKCILWTQDEHFAGLPSVNYFEKKK